ncbi:glycine/D-amino acid oxidase-like deaminating enzyme [Silvimonas terrae]|uniref:Glycine/D-amino acid oxidase-like deaminating enzyme n=1 Tax=Silvimonas terrae TaxID=300266 RepID=A0A840RND1_9NEIS|nr:FAD-dependent oxidoreductase [Silvimonas terrae]MBB5193692.1 glycine/D-amino acid oxidase-like deaminating enzyme [Silvimonas terrae]
MTPTGQMVEAVVIGGGLYGCTIASYLAQERGLRRVLLIEKEPRLLGRGSHNNQARVHNGYHYPRSFTTAYRSRINFNRFVQDWPGAVKRDFTKLYAIARRNSRVTARQFERFCHEIGAKIKPADRSLHALFEKRLIEEVFVVEEYAFDTTCLAHWAQQELARTGVHVRLGTRVLSISRVDGGLQVLLEQQDGQPAELIGCQYVFNCTYSGLNQFAGDFPGTQTGLKQEVTEMALIQAPAVLKDLGITVMDGPFFSMMPFPSRGLHTLSHVRYTPHFSWADQPDTDPYAQLENYAQSTRFDRMARDVARYLPAIADSQYVDSLFEIKTVLLKNEGDDGRPILFEKHPALPGCFSILGGKIDNVYDVLEKLGTEEFRNIPENQ